LINPDIFLYQAGSSKGSVILDSIAIKSI